MPARCAGQEYFFIQDLRPVMIMCRVNIRKDLTQMALLGLVIALVLSTVISLRVRRISPLLRQTVEAMANIASGKGDLTLQLQVSGRDE